MELIDLVVTPLVILLILLVAYVVRPYVTNERTRRFFFPALLLRLLCAILVGVLYQFYYNGGDTFNYHTNGSVVVHEVIMNQPLEGIRLWFSDGDAQEHPYRYVSRIEYFADPSSYMVIRVATFFDLFTFATYSGTACLFACISFISAWILFSYLTRLYPVKIFWLAVTILFVPSVVLWGSGILKDTLTNSALFILFFIFIQIIKERKLSVANMLLLLLGAYTLYVVKIYILLCFLPAVGIYITMSYSGRIRNQVLRWITYPSVLLISTLSIYFLLSEITEGNERYSLGNLSRTAQITAYDIAYWTGREAGSRYVLGELDGSYASMLKLAPQAVNVALFRPYFWEVNNFLMFFSAVESMIILLFTVYTISRIRISALSRIFSREVIFFLLFSLVFAFAVGISTYNFGTLSRYKIPMIPFYLLALVFINHNVEMYRRNKVTN